MSPSPSLGYDEQPKCQCKLIFWVFELKLNVIFKKWPEYNELTFGNLRVIYFDSSLSNWIS